MAITREHKTLHRRIQRAVEEVSESHIFDCECQACKAHRGDTRAFRGICTFVKNKYGF